MEQKTTQLQGKEWILSKNGGYCSTFCTKTDTATQNCMKKKKVISDFGDLKGKISFSEGTDMIPKKETHKGRTLDTSKATPKQSDSHEGLHVGQSVVLMDSDLRGKITKLGKTVTIELEDGLTIEATYGEFAVTSQTEISALKKAKAGKKADSGKASRRAKPSAVSALSVDLHIEAIPGGRSVPKGQQLQFQIDTFRRVLRENMHHKGMKITFIHGIGDGTLKSAVRKELDEVYALRCTYSVGDPAVTIVTII